jgi:NAD-dependent aldehyde dehydrogenases
MRCWKILKQRLSALRPGLPLDEQTLMGPLAYRVQFEKVLQLIEKAREEGVLPLSAAAKRCPATAILSYRRR